MKQYLKRVWLVLCMAACFFVLTACSAETEEAGEALDAQVALQITTFTEQNLEQITGITEDSAEIALESLKKQKQTAVAEAVASWLNVEQDTGKLVQVLSSEALETEDGGYVCTVNAQFEERNVEFKAFYEVNSNNYLVPTSFSIAPEYTLGENMAKAAMNTVLGMGTVFAVLIFISLLISCFKYISVFEDKLKAKRKAKQTPAAAPAPVAAASVAEAAEEELVDDLELVAVITAAIAASTGSSADGLVVRSIKRAPAAKWKRA